MGSLDGRVAIITGGGRGQGRSHAIHLAREGADIVVCGLDFQPETVDYPMFSEGDLEETVALVEQEDQRAIAIPADVRDYGQVERVVQAALDSFGKVDIMIANAGYGVFHQVHETPLDAWRASIDTHLTGVFHCIKAVAPHMIERRYGRIIATASAFGKQGAGNCAPYVAPKWGVIGLMKTAALDLGKFNITCNTLCPGTTETMASNNDLIPPMFFPDHPNPDNQMVDDFIKENWHHLPVGRIPVEAQSHAVVWLASEDARYVSGGTIDVSAGHAAGLTA